MAAAFLAGSASLGVASTIIPIADGGTSVVDSLHDNVYAFDVRVADGGFTHRFDLSGAGTALAEVSLTRALVPFYENLTMSWLDASDGSVLATTPVGPGGMAELSTAFAAPATLQQDLSIGWTSVDPNAPDFDGSVVVTIAPVPLPAGGLLLIAALGALAAVRRAG